MNSDLLPDLLLAVEQQLVSPQTPYVAETFLRLESLGIGESEAKTQLALCLGAQTDDMLRSKRPFDEKAYRDALEKLPLPGADGKDPE